MNANQNPPRLCHWLSILQILLILCEGAIEMTNHDTLSWLRVIELALSILSVLLDLYALWRTSR